jgi:hypothetical protein
MAPASEPSVSPHDASHPFRRVRDCAVQLSKGVRGAGLRQKILMGSNLGV